MTVESNANSPASLSEVLAQLPPEIRTEHIFPVGGMLYADGSKLLVLGGDISGKIVAVRLDAPAEFNPAQLEEGQNRFLDMSSFSEVYVRQVGIEAVRISTFRSITTDSSVGIEFKARDVDKDAEAVMKIDEDKMLRMMTGEEGGIAVFSGFNLPEDNALVLEERREDTRAATVLFMKPTDDGSFATDSVAGLYQFFLQLNSEFEGSQFPLQQAALRALDKRIRKGNLDFHGSDTREELFKTQVIALARLAAKTKNPKYSTKLEQLLPELRSDLKSRLRGLLLAYPSTQDDIEASINALVKKQFSGARKESGVAVRLTPVDDEILNKLSLTESRELWIKLAKDFSYRSSNSTSQYVITELIRRMYAARTPFEFRDLKILFDALFNSPFGAVKEYYSLSLSQTTGWLFWDTLAGRQSIGHMKSEILQKLSELEQEALGNSKPL